MGTSVAMAEKDGSSLINSKVFPFLIGRDSMVKVDNLCMLNP